MSNKITFVFVILSILIACTEKPTEPAQRYATNMPGELFFGPYNSDNPYDSVGIQHNICVNYALSCMQSTDTTKELCLASIRSALINYGVNHTSLSRSALEVIYDSSYALVIRTRYSQPSELNSDPGIWNPSEHAFIRRLSVILTSSLSFDIVRDSIAVVEGEILSSSNRSRRILEFVSILKHSCYYWNASASGLSKQSFSKYTNCQEEYIYPDIVRVADDIGYKYGIEIGDNDFCLAKELACMSSTVAAIMYYSGSEYPIHITVFLGL